MKITVITPNWNGARFLEESVRSIHAQACSDVELEHIVVDGGSTDASMEIVRRHRIGIARVISEPDNGPASAINKGLRLATGEVVAWLNADDRYRPAALSRVAALFRQHPRKALCFGRCPIMDEGGREIRTSITRFKELFFPFSSRFTIQCINYISQPAMFFRRAAAAAAGPLREDLLAAWDYEFVLRLWPHGGAIRAPGPALADFRWHASSISGAGFRTQFQEELDAAMADAGRHSLQAWIHRGVRWGIVTIYGRMAKRRRTLAE